MTSLVSCLSAAVLGTTVQSTLPPASEVSLRHQIYRDQGVTAYLLRIPPGQASQMHRHEKDLLTIFISGGRTTAVFEGSPARTDTLAAGTVRYRRAGFAHSTRNDDVTEFRAVLFEFDRPQGQQSEGAGMSQIFCTDRFCVEDNTLEPGTGLSGRGRGLFVPIEDILVRERSGRRHRQSPGTTWAGPRGWTNAGRRPVRVVSITFR